MVKRSLVSKFILKAFGGKYLLFTNIGLSFGLSAAGDVIEQKYEIINKDIQHFDAKRNQNMAFYGLTTGIVCHFWYNFLERRYPSFKLRSVMKKLTVDQLLFSPVIIANMFVTVGLLEGKNIIQIKDEFKEKFWKLYYAEWIVWPPAQFVNFYFVPPKFRVLYDNAVSLGYDVYYSHVKHIKHKIKDR